MPRARANGIEIEYDLTGDRSAEPLLLIMGLGAQMIAWDDEFVRALADRGHFVIRFDNRDVGLSTKFEGVPVPSPAELMRQTGEPPAVPYRLADMADDAAGLLDALEIESAHVVGASMGGMIAQQLAVAHAPRVRSLVSIMSSTGRPGLPRAKPQAMQRLMTPTPTEREAYIESSVEGQKIMAGSGFPFDEERARARAALSYDRCFHPQGTQRQMLAVMVSGSRHEALRSVKAPTLVIHGNEDPLVPVEGGIDTHESIPGSRLLRIEGMGHSLPRGAWPQIIEEITKHVASAD